MTRTELIARLRGRVQNNYYSLQDMKDALAMLEAEGAEFRPDWAGYGQGVKDGEAELDKLREAARLALEQMNQHWHYEMKDALDALKAAL